MKRILGLALLMAVAAAGLGLAASDSDKAKAFLEDGRKALDLNQPNSAVTLFRKAVASDAGNGEAHFRLAMVLIKLGDLAEVEAELRAARDTGYYTEEVDAALAEYYVQQGKYGKVLDEFPEGNRRKDLEARIRTARGYSQLNLKQMKDAEQAFRQGIAQAQTGLAQTRIVAGDLDGAAKLLQQAIETTPDFADPWILLGRVRALRNDGPGAKAAFDKALAIAPGSLPGLFSRASLLVDMGDLEHAAVDVAAMLDQQPDNWRANLLDGIIKARQERWREAEAALMAIPVPEELPETLFTLARVNLAQGQISQADANITHYLAIVPNSPKGLGVKAAILTARSKPAAAIDLLNRALAQAPDNPAFLALLADAYAKNGQGKEAATTLDRLSAVAPRDVDTRVQIAQQKIAVGHVDEALDDLAVARATEPLSPKALTTTIEALIAAKRYDEAVRATEELRGQQPDSAVAETFLGVIDAARRNFAAARGHFAKALASKPDFTTAAIDLAQAYRAEEKTDEARAVFDRAAEQNPRSAEILLARAELETADNKPDAALTYLERARAADPLAAEPRFRLVRGYIERKEPAKAVAVAYELEKIAPRNPKAITALAEAQLANNDRETAIQTFGRVIEMTGGAPDPLLRLAGVLVLGGDVKSGYSTMRKALESNPVEPRVQQAMLEFAQKTGTVGASIDFVTELRQRQPDDAGLALLLGRLYEIDRRFERAAAAYQAGMAKRPGSDFARGIARSLAQGPKPEMALPGLVAWLDKHPDDREARLLQAEVLTKTKQYDAAIAECERLQAADGKDAAVLNNLAWLYSLKSDKRALMTAEAARRLAPSSPTIADTYGWILLQNGELKRGLELLREAASGSPKPTVRYHLAVALSKSGQREDALRVLNELVQSADEFDDRPAAQALIAQLRG